MKTKDKSLFRVNDNHGFQITFPNGVTVSVQFDDFHYCDNHNLPASPRPSRIYPPPTPGAECANAELAIFEKDTTSWLTRRFDPTLDDDVAGYQTPAQVLKALNWAAKYKPRRRKP